MTADLRDLSDALGKLDRIVGETTVEGLPALIMALNARIMTATGRMMINGQMVQGNGNGQGRPAEKEPEKLLTIEEALLLLPGVTRRQLLRLTKGLRFRRGATRKRIWFEEAGLQKWIKSLGTEK